MTWNSPFASTVASPGKGEVVLSLLPPSIPTLETLTYKYPLKLLSRAVGFTPESSVLPPCAATRPIHLYLLTYGGGLLPGDKIDVSITLHPRTRLVVTTPQGSTKIFKTASDGDGGRRRRVQRSKEEKDDMSRQVLDVRIGSQAALCYLPDPTAPFKDSRYEQIQRFTVDGGVMGNERSSLCVLDWVTQGRTSRGEDWDFHFWKGKNEVWSVNGNGEKRRLLLRDSVILDDEMRPGVDVEESEETNNNNTLIRERTRPHGIVGTLILYGPVFDHLASFIIQTFTSQPRIGGRNWSSSATDASSPATEVQQYDVTWTAARVRAGFVLVKFGAKDFETARDWLGSIIREEGSIIREFGEEALFSI